MSDPRAVVSNTVNSCVPIVLCRASACITHPCRIPDVSTSPSFASDTDKVKSYASCSRLAVTSIFSSTMRWIPSRDTCQIWCLFFFCLFFLVLVLPTFARIAKPYIYDPVLQVLHRVWNLVDGVALSPWRKPWAFHRKMHPNWLSAEKQQENAWGQQIGIRLKPLWFDSTRLLSSVEISRPKYHSRGISI